MAFNQGPHRGNQEGKSGIYSKGKLIGIDRAFDEAYGGFL